jgi:uncharacterized membrane protein
MVASYFIHILAGTAGLLAGYVALYSTKGAPLHWRAGTVFVYAMLTMCGTAIVVAITRNAAPALNISAATLTAALVVTSVTTLRTPGTRTQALDAVGLLAAAGVGIANLVFGFEAAGSPRGLGRDGMPAFPFFMFGVVGCLAAIGDLRILRSGPLTGTFRIARHLWRMCFALFVAALSFFIGQADVIPEPIRIRPILGLPVLAVIATMFYWLWRVRIRRMVQGLVVARPTAT